MAKRIIICAQQSKRLKYYKEIETILNLLDDAWEEMETINGKFNVPAMVKYSIKKLYMLRLNRILITSMFIYFVLDETRYIAMMVLPLLLKLKAGKGCQSDILQYIPVSNH